MNEQLMKENQDFIFSRPTYSELLSRLETLGDTCAETKIEKIMNEIEEETGITQSWSFAVPDWAVKSCFDELGKPKQDKRKSMERE